MQKVGISSNLWLTVSLQTLKLSLGEVSGSMMKATLDPRLLTCGLRRYLTKKTSPLWPKEGGMGSRVEITG